MRSRSWLFFLFLFIFSSCSPRGKQSAIFSSATSLSDETVKFLPPAVEAESIDGGVRLDTMIPGDASHVEINFNGTILKSCSAETLIPEGVATCPVGEESCEIQVKACNEATEECSDSLDITVFMNTESALPSDVNSVMAAYELEQEQIKLARDLKLEACVAAKELEKYSEADVSPEALALRDGIEAICKTSDCDVVLGFDQFKSDLEGLISQLAIQAVLEDEADDTGELSETEEGDDTTDVTGNDTDEPSETEEGDETNELSETEIVLTAVSATLGVALLGGGGTGIYLWRKQARLEGELRAKDINLASLNQNLVDLNKTKQDLEKKITEGGNKEELEKIKELLEKEKAQLIEQKRLAEEAIKQRADAETKLTNAKAEYEAEKAKSLQEMQATIEELRRVNAEQGTELVKLREQEKTIEAINQNKVRIEDELKTAQSKITKIEESLAEKEKKGATDSEELERLKAELEKQKNLAGEAIKQKAAAETKLAKAKTEYEAEKAKSLQEMQAKIAELKEVNAKNAEQLAELEELRKKVKEIEAINQDKVRLEAELKTAELKITEIEQLLAASKVETENLKSSLLVNQTELTNAEGRIEELKKTGVTSSEELELIKNKNAKLRRKITVQKNRIEQGIKNDEELRARIEKDVDEVKRLIDENKKLKESLDAKNTELQTMKSEYMEVRSLLAELMGQDSPDTQKSLDNLKTEVTDALAKKAEEIKSNAEMIERQKAEIRKLQDEAKAAKAAKDSEVAELNKKLENVQAKNNAQSLEKIRLQQEKIAKIVAARDAEMGELKEKLELANKSLGDLEKIKQELEAAKTKIKSLEISVESLETDVNSKGKTIVLIRWQNFLRAQKHQNEIKELQEGFEKKNNENLKIIGNLTGEVEELKRQEVKYWKYEDDTGKLQDQIKKMGQQLEQAKLAQEGAEQKLKEFKDNPLTVENTKTILDEIDGFLDKKNSALFNQGVRYMNYINLINGSNSPIKNKLDELSRAVKSNNKFDIQEAMNNLNKEFEVVQGQTNTKKAETNRPEDLLAFFRDLRKGFSLTSDSTDDFMERVSQFFSNVATKHAKAYQNNLELEELRVNFF
jgi:chromosome segregation ATPase